MQLLLVRAYKVVGMGLLTAILVGLVGFVTVNVFYFFSESWLRPVIITHGHPRAVEAAARLEAAQKDATALLAERTTLHADVAELTRTLDVAERFLTDAEALIPRRIRSAEEVMLRREFDRVALDRNNALARKRVLDQQLSELETRIAHVAQQVAQLETTPFARAQRERVIVAFVPYANLRSVRTGTSLFACVWGLVRCRNVGHISSILEGEVEEHHPHDQSIQRGVLVEVAMSDASAAEGRVLFAGSKPFGL